MTQTIDPTAKRPGNEPEFVGPLWKHPYMVYVLLTLVIFAGLSFAGWLFYSNGLIPDRGIKSPSSGQSP